MQRIQSLQRMLLVINDGIIEIVSGILLTTQEQEELQLSGHSTYWRSRRVFYLFLKDLSLPLCLCKHLRL